MAATLARDSTTEPTPHAEAIPRRYELDWLRALVVLGLIPIHAAVIFSTTADTYIKNSQTNPFMALLGAFAGAWGMPLLFLVAGAAAYFALNRRSTLTYLKERALRLLVPFVFATLVIVPVQVYAVASSDPSIVRGFSIPIQNPDFLSSYPAFFVEYLRAYLYFATHFSLPLAIVFWGHLWFIPRLFAYALCTIPLFLFLKSRTGVRLLGRLNNLLRYPGAIFLFALPLMLVEMLLRASHLDALTAHWPIYDDWIQFTFYLVCFIYGYLLYAVSEMSRAIVRHGWLALGLGVAGLALALARAGGLTTDPMNYSLGYILGWPIRGMVCWFWVVAILSLALTRLGFTNRLLRYLNDAAFPIYVLHMPVVTIVGMYIIRLDISWALKFALIIVVAFGLTIALVELLVRRFNPMRLLFGLKPRGPSPKAAKTPRQRQWSIAGSHLTGGHDHVR